MGSCTLKQQKQEDTLPRAEDLELQRKQAQLRFIKSLLSHPDHAFEACRLRIVGGQFENKIHLLEALLTTLHNPQNCVARLKVHGYTNKRNALIRIFRSSEMITLLQTAAEKASNKVIQTLFPYLVNQINADQAADLLLMIQSKYFDQGESKQNMVDRLLSSHDRLFGLQCLKRLLRHREQPIQDNGICRYLMNEIIKIQLPYNPLEQSCVEEIQVHLQQHFFTSIIPTKLAEYLGYDVSDIETPYIAFEATPPEELLEADTERDLIVRSHSAGELIGPNDYKTREV